MRSAVAKLPPNHADQITHNRRVAETVNNILGFQHDDSRIQTQAEKLAGVTPVNYAYPLIDMRRFGATLQHSGDDTAALGRAIATAGQTVDSSGGVNAIGNAVKVPAVGISILSSTVTLPNRVKLTGDNTRGSYFQAISSWSLGAVPAMFYAVGGAYSGSIYTPNTASSMFDSRLENLTVDCNNVSGLGGVATQAWQEKCGLRDVLIVNFQTYGLKFLTSSGGTLGGGQSSCKLEDVEIFGGSGIGAGSVGIDIQKISNVGAFKVDLIDVVVSGFNNSTLLPIGVNIVFDSVHALNVHFEDVTTGFYLNGAGNHVLIGCDGSSTTVTNLVEIDAAFTGTLTMIGCSRNGASNFVVDHRTGGVGTITGYDPPILHINSLVLPVVAIGANWSSGVFDGTAGSPTLASGYNVSGITKNGTGDYTITENKSRPVVNCAPWVMSNLANASYRADLVGAGSYRLRIYVGGVLTDSNEVKFANVRLA